MYKGFAWAILLFLSMSSNANVAYQQGVENVLYQLYLDPDAEVDDELELLAQRGSRSAALLLAQRWSRSSNFSQLADSVKWYVKAFDAGRGDVAALAGLAQVGNQVPYFHDRVGHILRAAQAQYAVDLSPQTVRSTLDIYLMYPELFSSSDVDRLLSLHRRGCVENCFYATYEAQQLLLAGKQSDAVSLFESAMESDPRVVALLASMWGESGRDKLVELAEKNVERIDDYSPDSVEALALEVSSSSTDKDAVILRWVDAAIDTGSHYSLMAKAEYMMERPQTYDYPPALEIIEKVQLESESDALYLASQAHLIYQWRILNPARAEQELDLLAATKPVQAQFAKAQLYSMGGLDEPNPDRAIAIYQQLITQRNIQAFYRLATLYNGAPAVVRDKAQAFGYASVASELGDKQASYMVQRLNQELTGIERAEAVQLRNRLMAEMELTL
ncbi:SEL1-like repeat protein [Gilvimarinus agarilyticus]|uniref:sel1 repeat family protein n=1 Tax=Gilvimarinus agarilyticus TaxID=679259 RepID=UPI0005A20018|nr:sel1 repeat family protein [Gilvimarinus agarilyticus]